ncbi:NB-ARC domain-containing protein [Microcoleus sp. F10-C6]|uniref:NB-ARC domain-containing protein n=1 Tax=unclassified Microcoleus TaxID=2642155 RepID=UPI002FCE98AA
MDVQEVLKWADELVFTKKGKHLSSLQETILTGVWSSQKYGEIAETCNCTENHVKKVASEIWQLFSATLDEDVNKSNFKATLDRMDFSNNISSFWKDVSIGSMNVCTETSNPPKTPQHSPPAQTSTEDDTQQKPRLDLRDAPELRTFYNYPNSPLTALENSIARQNCRLLTITGMTGTGKSAIARNLIPQIQTQFDRIIWRSLRTSPPLETTLKNIIQFICDRTDINFSTNTDDQLSILIETLRENRCLIILDDVQQILSSGQLAGNYKPGYENYGTLFKLIGEIPHHSCLILNSWEPPSDIITFTDDNSAVRSLQLTGLSEAATEILRQKGLLDEETWPELINLYQGNPLWLKLVAQTINHLFGGRVSHYLSYQPVFLGDELTPILQQHYQRLSEIEKQAISQLSNEIEPVSFPQFMAKCQGSQRELCQAIQSLARRGMIEKLSYESEIVFTIPPVLKQYVKMVAE